ncbi:hypothetical protein LUZ62_066083 [Rhynchospora pubera]|uniref:Uncharacterized protein n=2 Tax=Rhynchospora pubera TaxID=906938 RepID=A0AAV8EU64_9POAL|nr:hypothetical protein LUZ62_066083 [Rhynchospora pubera]
MESRDEESVQETEKPLLHDNGGDEGDGHRRASRLEKAVSEGGRGAAVLAKHLPTGSALMFEVLVPITTARGKCQYITRIETICLIVICAILSIILAFTDSFRDSRGKLRYGIATFTGIFVFDRTQPPPDQNKYRITATDFLHAFTALIIFLAVVLYNKEVNECFFSEITDEYTLQIFAAAPILIGVLGCILFVCYPSTRHGFGFPIGGLASEE